MLRYGRKKPGFVRGWGGWGKSDAMIRQEQRAMMAAKARRMSVFWKDTEKRQSLWYQTYKHEWHDPGEIVRETADAIAVRGRWDCRETEQYNQPLIWFEKGLCRDGKVPGWLVMEKAWALCRSLKIPYQEMSVTVMGVTIWFAT